MGEVIYQKHIDAAEELLKRNHNDDVIEDSPSLSNASIEYV